MCSFCLILILIGGTTRCNSERVTIYVQTASGTVNNRQAWVVSGPRNISLKKYYYYCLTLLCRPRCTVRTFIYLYAAGQSALYSRECI
jgi:hypothetical protein